MKFVFRQIIIWSDDDSKYYRIQLASCFNLNIKSRDNIFRSVFCPLLTPQHIVYFLVWPKYQKLIGHRSKVTCLLYPYGEYDRYAPEHLVSGSADFTVKLWNLTSGALLTSFSVNGGEIVRLTCTPPECSVSWKPFLRPGFT